MSQPLPDINEMDSSYLNEEDLEDVEITLYGLLHHAPNDTLDSHGSSPVISSQSSSPTPLPNQLELRCVSLKPIPSSSTSTETRQPFQCQPSKSNQSESNSTSVLCKKKNASAKKLERTNHQQLLRKSIFKEYLVVEHNTSKAQQQNPVKSINKITDCEDSKYEDIRKSSKLNRLPILLNIENSSSSDDDSIVILNGNAGSNCLQQRDESDSSDSDSGSEVQIIEDYEECPESRIKLNVSGTCISDVEEAMDGIPVNPEWRKYVCSKWSQEMVEYYEQRKPVKDLDEILQKLSGNSRLWKLDDSDRYGFSLPRNRYFGRSQHCDNCKQRDHPTRLCPDPPKQKHCHFCGNAGHTHYRCQNKVCLGCGRPSQMFNENCHECRRERTVVCMICRLSHTTQQCPDLWRRYHLTTTATDALTVGQAELRSSRSLYCCNCATKGHLWFECKDIKWSKYPTVKPAIFSYEDSKEFLDRVTDGGKKSVVVSDDRKSVWVVGSPPKDNKHFLSYSFHPGGKISERRMNLAQAQVNKEVHSVEICWRMQKKKGRFIVEFRGKGDKHEARKRFKKLIHIHSNQLEASASSKTKVHSNCATTNKMSASPRKVSPEKDKLKSPADPSVSSKGSSSIGQSKKEQFIKEVAIKYVNGENKELRCLNRIGLNPAQKRDLGKLMAKCQNRYRVSITSSVVGKKLEIYIGSSRSEVTNQSGQAFLCINKFLQSVKN